MKIAFLLSEFNMPTKELRGSNVYLLKFIMNCAKNFQVDVFCQKSDIKNYENLNITVDDDLSQFNKQYFEKNNYDFVGAAFGINNKFMTFGLLHAHSLIYREQIVRTPFEMFVKRIFDRKRLITQEKKEAIKQGFINIGDILFANSTLAKEDYVNLVGVDEKKVFVLTPCVNIEPSENLPNNDIFTFGISAVSFALKGGYTLLKALFLLKFKNSKFKVKIIYPNHKNKYFLKMLIWILGLSKNIEFSGFVGNMKEFYESIDCLIAPSREETFGLVILEAMTYSRPVIISSRCGAKDIIKHGENGWVFDYDKNVVKNLAKNLEIVLKEKNIKNISKNAYKTAKLYDENNHAKRIYEILNKIKEDN